MHSTWTHQNFGGKLPSEIFREHFLTCFISDKVGVKLRNMIGIDNICWEADYPHSDSMWPGAPEELWDVLSVEQRAGRRDQEDDLRERDALVLVRPVHPHHPGAGDGRRAAQGRRGARRVHSGTQPPQRHRAGSSFADFAANAKELTGNKD